MLAYHAIAHQRCAEQLAQVEADWRAITARDDQVARPAAPPPPVRRAPAAALVRRILLGVLVR